MLVLVVKKFWGRRAFLPWNEIFSRDSKTTKTVGRHTSNMRHLFVVGEFFVVSHLKIFPLQLLGPADKPMAGLSSSKGKILR